MWQMGELILHAVDQTARAVAKIQQPAAAQSYNIPYFMRESYLLRCAISNKGST